MAIVASIAAVASAVVGAYSAYAQGQAQSQMAAYNATIARQNRELELERMKLIQTEKEIMEERVRRELARTIGKQKVAWAKAGVDPETGTALLAEAESLVRADLDALAIRYASTIEQAQSLARQATFRQEEMLQRMKGMSALTAGYLGAGQSLLTGATNVYGIGAKAGWW